MQCSPDSYGNTAYGEIGYDESPLFGLQSVLNTEKLFLLVFGEMKANLEIFPYPPRR